MQWIVSKNEVKYFIHSSKGKDNLVQPTIGTKKELNHYVWIKNMLGVAPRLYLTKLNIQFNKNLLKGANYSRVALSVEKSTVRSATDCLSAFIFDELSNPQALHDVVHHM